MKTIPTPALLAILGLLAAFGPAEAQAQQGVTLGVGAVNTGSSEMSVAHMVAPSGWIEPGQRPEFDEVTLVIEGVVRVETETAVIDVAAGQAFRAERGEWVRYSTPLDAGAEYIAVCLPAFSPDTVHRDES